MKNWFPAILIALAAQAGRAQDTIPLYSDALAKQQATRQASLRPGVGIDLYQTVWVVGSLFQRDTPPTYAYPVSVTLYLPVRQKFGAERTLFLNAGYVAYGGSLQRNIYQTGNGFHLRAGIDQTRNRLIGGFSGLATGWLGQGSFLFKGTTFGDYQESLGRMNGLVVGGESHVGYSFPLGHRLSLRTCLRGSLLYQLTASRHDLYVPHLSGIDWNSGRSVSFGMSLQANLVFGL